MAELSQRSGCRPLTGDRNLFWKRLMNSMYINLSPIQRFHLSLQEWWQGWWYMSAFHKTEEEINNEQRIILECQKNPEGGHFGYIYEKYYEQIFGFVYKRILDEDDTADVTSRAFMNCLSKISQYQFKGLPFSSWLYKIAINEVHQFYRDKKKDERIVSIESTSLHHFFEEMDFEGQDIDAASVLEQIFEEVEQSEVDYLSLRFFENKSFKEIGEIHGISEVNAKVKTYRLLKRLKSIAEKLTSGVKN